MIGTEVRFRLLYDVKPGDVVLVQVLDTITVESWHTEDIKTPGRIVLAFGIPGPKDWSPAGLIPKGWKPLLHAPFGKIFTLWVNNLPMHSGNVITGEGRFGFLADSAFS